jgi:hypothetical protein
LPDFTTLQQRKESVSTFIVYYRGEPLFILLRSQKPPISYAPKSSLSSTFPIRFQSVTLGERNKYKSKETSKQSCGQQTETLGGNQAHMQATNREYGKQSIRTYIINRYARTVKVSERSKARILFVRLESGIVGSNPTQGMNVWYVYVFILCLCCPVFR